MSPWVEKVLALFSLALATLIATLIPFKLVPDPERCSSGKTWRKHGVDWMNCFSGGVFLSTVLLHLFPEVSQGFKELMEHFNVQTSFPIAELTISCGFFMVLLLEAVFLKLLTNYIDKRNEEQQQMEHCEEPVAQQPTVMKLIRILDPDKIVFEAGFATEKLSDNRGSITNQSLERSGELGQILDQDQPVCKTGFATNKSTDELQPLVQKSFINTQLESSNTQRVHTMRLFVFLIALSVHTCFEGLVLGLTQSSQTLWRLFAAVLIHKSAVGFSIGSQFAEAFPYSDTLKGIGYMVLFALMCPVGIAVGTLVSEVHIEESSAITSLVVGTILQGLATGTFLHVTFFEILGKQVGSSSSFIKLLLVFLGYVCVALVSLFRN